MAQPYIGQILAVGFAFTPRGYVPCNGQLLSIADYETLYVLLGVTYGGDGQSTFGVPDLRSRTPIHMGTGGGASYALGQIGGQESVTLTALQTPVHTHGLTVQTDAGNLPTPAGNYLAGSNDAQYTATPNSATGAMLLTSGSGQSHSNIQPVLCINYVIAVEGVFPARN